MITFLNYLLFVSIYLLLSHSCFAAIYTYDSLNRLSTVTYGADKVVTYTYDKAGNITSIRKSANLPGVTNSVCGTADGVIAAAKPAANLCLSGKPTDVLGNGPWYWSCESSNGGTSPFCSTATPVNLNITLAGAGSGSVNSSPSGIACTSGSCNSDFVKKSSISLIALPSTGSSFFGWSGACSGSGSCSVTADSSKSATATFSIYNPIVMIDGQPPSYFTALASAYGTIKPSSSVIMKAQEGDYDEDLIMVNTADLTFTGGFENTFTTASGYSRLRGNLIIASGSLVVEKLIIAPSPGTVASESSAVFGAGDASSVLLSTLKLALDTIPDNSAGTIRANSGTLEGGFILNRDTNLTLLGGLGDTLTEQGDGYLHIKGGLVIAHGALTVDKIILE